MGTIIYWEISVKTKTKFLNLAGVLMEHFSADGVTLLGHIGMLTQMRRVQKEISSFELDTKTFFH